MTGIGKRLRQARDHAGLSQADLAKRAGMTQQAIDALEQGRARTSLKVNKIAKELNVSASWLETGMGSMEDERREWRASSEGGLIEVAGAEYARIPVYDIRVAAGVGAQNYDETPIDYYMLSLDLLRGATDAPLSFIHGLQVMGDSMEETLHDRDWVLIDSRQQKLTREGLFGLNFEGDAIIKRASQHLETRAVTLISDNPKYPQQVIKKPDRLIVLGRVFMSIRRH